MKSYYNPPLPYWFIYKGGILKINQKKNFKWTSERNS